MLTMRKILTDMGLPVTTGGNPVVRNIAKKLRDRGFESRSVIVNGKRERAWVKRTRPLVDPTDAAIEASLNRVLKFDND